MGDEGEQEEKQMAQFQDILGSPGSGARYEKMKLLGKGSFGQAWRLRDAQTGQILVGKEMALNNMSTKDLAYVEAEIRCLSACHHFAIVRYVEDYKDGDTMLILMEYADAGDLNLQIKQRANQGGRHFEEHEVGYTLIQLCMALDHVHRRKMLHRDIKGANVFLMSNGLVKLGDFGFAQVYENTVSEVVAGTFCGTPYYLPPEMWKRQRYSKKADVWSLGILLYEMMALKRPFQGQGMRNLMESVLKGQIAPLPGKYSQELQDLTMSMLVADPNRRPSLAQIMSTPYMIKLLGDFEKSVGSSTLIDDGTKELIAQNIQEARDLNVDANSGNHSEAVGQIRTDVFFEGPIRKESNSQWKERYFVLHEGQLTIAVKKGDQDTKSISVTTLSSVVPIPFHAAKADGVFALNTLDNKTMWMQAPSKQECNTWVHKIQQAMGVA